jgi:purine nucleosidase
MPLVHTPAIARLEAPLQFQGAFGDTQKFAPPGSFTALGPMTNIAMLLRLHPHLESKIRRIGFMGGNVHVLGNASAAAEFNFWFDPEAAQAMLRSRIPEKVMFPLDICNRAVVTKSRFDEIVAAKTAITERYRKDYGLRYTGFLNKPDATGFLWDELAAAWLLDTGFVTKSESGYLDVDTRFGKTCRAKPHLV